MNLIAAVTLGRFCGLNTVEECISNIERHSISLFIYTEMQEELEELHEDYDLFLDGHYKLDIEKIDKENQEEMDRWIEQEKNQEFDESEDLNFDFKD